MYNFKNLKRDVASHLENYKTIYLMLLFCFIIGLVVGLIISLSKTSYLGLLDVKDKNLINIINGNTSLISNFWKCLFSFLLPLIFIFLFSLNYYFSFVNFLFFGYQSTILFLTNMAMIQSYSFSGFIKVFLIVLPINIIYFLIMMYSIVVCFCRVKCAHKYKRFLQGFNYNFITKLGICLLFILFLSFLSGIILPLVLKSAIFLIF